MDTPQFVKDVIMNSLYIIPSMLFMFTYMVLICIWIEITMFSRDQYLIQHSRYNCVWKAVWGSVTSLILCALLFVFIYAWMNQNLDFITGLYTSLWIMSLFNPLFAFVVWLALVVRFAGFPYLNGVWRQQTSRMFYVVSVWTVGQLVSGVMISIWTADDGDWMKKDEYIWFSLSVALTLVFSEMIPLIYTSDWQRMGFLLMDFVNWRDLWLRNERQGLAHDPRLVDDLFSKSKGALHKDNGTSFEFKRALCLCLCASQILKCVQPLTARWAATCTLTTSRRTWRLPRRRRRRRSRHRYRHSRGSSTCRRCSCAWTAA